VGLVVVSHSRPLARSAIALAEEMLHGSPVRIELAAGLDDTTLGTDAVAIMEAIQRADAPDGVVVLMDLGSAVLSAELALDLLEDPDVRDRVTLSAAPLVEGLVVAAVAAAGGAGRAEVASEALDALLGKSAQLASPDDDGASGSAGPGGEEVGVLTVRNPHGLHARPAARLVREVRALDVSVLLRNLTTDGPSVPGDSLSRVATLAAARGHEVEVRASGRQAREAVDRLLDLAKRRFDEPAEQVPEPAAPTPPPILRGPSPAAPGIAVGPVRRLTSEPRDFGQPAAPPDGSPDEE
jgi:multiphosphoryl transfer protein